MALGSALLSEFRDETFSIKKQLAYELRNHPNFYYYIGTTNLKNNLQRIIFEVENPAKNKFELVFDDELIFWDEGRYILIFESFFANNETAKKLGYLESLKALDFACQTILNCNEKIEEQDMQFFYFNHLNLYRQFLELI